MTAKILAALKQLDTKNDNHWTGEGSPRMDTVKMLAGDSSLTKDVVTLAAPGFSRSNPVLPDDTDAPAVSGVVAGGDDDKADTVGDGSGDPADPPQEPPTQEPEQAAPTSELDAAKQRVAESAARKAQAEKEYAAAVAAQDAVIVSVEAKPETFAEQVKRHFAAQDRLQQERVRKIEEGKALSELGLGQFKAQVRAKIDQAFERKRGRGMQRPTRVTTGRK
jgi:hypothetical protein